MTVEIPAAECKGYRRDGRIDVVVRIPYDYEHAVTVLSGKMQAKRLTQLYVKLALPRKPRTTGWRSQSHHVNGHVQTIAAYTGDSFDDVKMHVKREAIADGYQVRTNSWGEVVPQSEADASTVECAMLIDAAHRVASFLGVALKEYDDE